VRAVRGPVELTLRVAGVPAAAIAALLIAGCGGSGQPPQGVGVGVGLTAGPQVSVFTCQDWNDADPQTRFSTVAKIRAFVGGPVTGSGANGNGTVLDDEQAYKYFEDYCAADLAKHFLLYKLYGRAAGFAGQAPPG
jgi:hypothetical protein